MWLFPNWCMLTTIGVILEGGSRKDYLDRCLSNPGAYSSSMQWEGGKAAGLRLLELSLFDRWRQVRNETADTNVTTGPTLRNRLRFYRSDNIEVSVSLRHLLITHLKTFRMLFIELLRKDSGTRVKKHCELEEMSFSWPVKWNTST